MRARIHTGWYPHGRDSTGARCLTGAFYEALCQHSAPIDEWMRERHRLLVLLGFESTTTEAAKVSGAQMVAWNDACGRTQQNVLDRIDAAILIA